MHGTEYEAAVAAFIRAKGVTRCPTACALPTQGTVPAGDRAASPITPRLATNARRRASARSGQQARHENSRRG